MIDYPLHQYRLLVPLAESIGSIFAAKEIARLWDKNKKNLFKENNIKLAEIHALISAVKVLTMEATSKSLTEARLACGGIGYSHYSGLVHRLNDHNV